MTHNHIIPVESSPNIPVMYLWQMVNKGPIKITKNQCFL